MKARLAASIALASALLVGSTGCTLVSVNGTLKEYQPSDGAGATIGDLEFRNVLGLSEDGEDVALAFTVVNEGDSDQTVKVQFTDAGGDKVDTEIEVGAGESVGVGYSGDDQLVLRDAGATVGGLFPVYFSFGEEGEAIAVPILDGTQLEYAELLPGERPSPRPTQDATEPEPDADVDADLEVE